MEWLKVRVQGRSRWLWRKVTGRDRGYTPQVELPVRHFGTTYGGAYLWPAALSKNSLVYAIGVGQDLSLALDLIEAFGLEVFAFDPTPESIEWVGQQPLPPQLHFFPWGVADFDGTARFYPNSDATNNHNFSLEVRTATQERAIEAPFRRLESILRELGHTQIDLLRMDIEGAEYRVLDDMHRSGIAPTQVAVEFHHDKYNDPLETRRAVRRLGRRGYRIAAVQGRDMSFVKR